MTGQVRLEQLETTSRLQAIDVYLFGDEDDLFATTQPDSTGRRVFESVPPGEWRLETVIPPTIPIHIGVMEPAQRVTRNNKPGAQKHDDRGRFFAGIVRLADRVRHDEPQWSPTLSREDFD